MGIWQDPETNPKRRPAMRGAVMLDVTHGAPRIRAWPSPRGKGGTPAQKKQREWFRQASWAIKYMAPEMQSQVMEARIGKPLLPRDMLMMMLSGRLMSLALPSGQRLFPAVSITDVSQSLDTISAIPGSMLVRKADQWTGVPAPDAGTGEAWSLLTFSTPGVTAWQGLTWFRADETWIGAPGQTIEIQVKFRRLANQEIGVGLSPDATQICVLYHWQDGLPLLGKYASTGASFDSWNAGPNDFDGSMWETLTLSATITESTGGVQNLYVGDNGWAPRVSAAQNAGTFNLLGPMQPFYITCAGGLPNAVMARYRIINP